METINNMLEQYNFTVILNEYQEYKEWCNELYALNKAKAKEEYKNNNPRPPFTQPHFSRGDLTAIDMSLADIKAIKGDNGLYSPSLTLKGLQDQNVKDLLKYLRVLTSRSDYYHGTATENTRWCSLVPIFLAAQKEYNAIGYEEWDKEDKYITIIMSNPITDTITKWRDTPLSEELRKVARHNALNWNGKTLAPIKWPMHNISIDGSTKLKPTDLFRHMWLQTWVANAELRNEYMILDVDNWDLMPEALDAVYKAPHEGRGKERRVVKQVEEDLPF